MQEPLPLKFKLHPWPLSTMQSAADQTSADSQSTDQPASDSSAAVKEDTLQEMQSFGKVFKPMNQPLGLLEQLPFQVSRTHTGNLPVYTDFRAGGNRKVTVVRKIYGDVDEFKSELSKIVSNADIKDKMGRLEISGLHSQKVKFWLTRLGF